VRSTCLGRNGYQQPNEEGDLLLVECLHNGHNANGISTTRPSISKDGDQNVLLDVEGSGIHGPLPFGKGNRKLGGGKNRCHEAAEWQSRNLSGDCRDCERLRSIGEELIEECQNQARENPECPHAECVHRSSWIIGGGHRECHFLNRRLIIHL